MTPTPSPEARGLTDEEVADCARAGYNSIPPCDEPWPDDHPIGGLWLLDARCAIEGKTRRFYLVTDDEAPVYVRAVLTRAAEIRARTGETMPRNCCRVVCRAPNATWWNTSTRDYYCQPCALRINAQPGQMGLCVQSGNPAHPGTVATKAPQVGCENAEGTLNIHAESETCEVCAPVVARDALAADIATVRASLVECVPQSGVAGDRKADALAVLSRIEAMITDGTFKFYAPTPEGTKEGDRVRITVTRFDACHPPAFMGGGKVKP